MLRLRVVLRRESYMLVRAVYTRSWRRHIGSVLRLGKA